MEYQTVNLLENIPDQQYTKLEKKRLGWNKRWLTWDVQHQ